MGKNAELVREVFRDFNRSGIDSVLDLMDPQIEVIDLPQVPEERRRRGREAVAAWFNSLEDVWARLRVHAEEVTELDAERVLAAVRFSGHARGSGMDIEQRVAIVCTIRDGKAVRWQIYPSRDEAIADASGPKLLSGGNPQIPKGEGDEPVHAYIAAMPGWKRSLGERLDRLVVRTVPDVHKAVKWNQPFYGHEDEGWFLAFRCYTKYVQLQFFRGTSLDPVPPKSSKHDEVRYLDIYEDDDVDEHQLMSWIEQASNLPGEKM